MPPSASTASVSLKLRFVSEDEQKTVTLEYSQQEAVHRTYAPQGFFGLLGVQLDGTHYIEVDLNDPFFQTISVNLLPPPAPTDIGLLSAAVGIDYGSTDQPDHFHHADFVFTPQASTAQQFSAYVTPDYDLSYGYSVDYDFDPATPWQGKDLAYHFGPRRQDDRTVRFDPRYDLDFLDVRIVPGRIDKALIDRIDVNLSYTGDDGWTQSSVVTVHAGDAEQHWKLRVTDRPAVPYTYFFTHHLLDGTAQTTDPVTTAVRAIVVDDPFTHALNLDFIPLFDRTKYVEVFIDVTYDDAANNYHRSERIVMRGNTTSDELLRIAVLNPSLLSFTYQLTFVGVDNSFDQRAAVTTDKTLVPVN